MSYDYHLLLNLISGCLRERPAITLNEISTKARVSRRTIENVLSKTLNKPFREMRRDLLVERLRQLLRYEPTITIKEISFALGYQSARSFARAVRDVCGVSPSDIRSAIARELANTPDHLQIVPGTDDATEQSRIENRLSITSFDGRAQK